MKTFLILITSILLLTNCTSNSSEPNTKFTYSHSTDVLAYIIEVVSQQSLDAFLEENLFKSLEMKDTGYKIAAEKMANLATIYGYDETDQLFARENNTESVYTEGHLPRGNFGLVSTVEDYSHFATMLLNKGSYKGKQILQPETVEMMTANQLADKLLPIEAGGMKFDNLGFGYGFAVSQGDSPLGKVVGSFGWIGASHTYCFIDPENEVIGILFTQLSGTRKCPILFQFNGWMYEGLYGNTN